MALQTCPACFTEVERMADGRCPSCLVAMSGDARWRRIELREGDRALAPEMCHRCGVATDEVTDVIRVRIDDPQPAITRLVRFACGPLLGWLARQRHRERLAIALPMCRGCYGERPPEPLSVNWSRWSMEFLVLPAFGTALEAARARSGS